MLTKEQAISAQWETFDHKHMIINHKKFPMMTEYNLTMLCDDLKYHHNIDITKNEYFTITKKLKLVE